MKPNDQHLPTERHHSKNSFTHPIIDMGKLFILFLFLLLTYQLNAQSTYMLNGRLITELNGKCFSVTNGDTVYIDKQFITVKFKDDLTDQGRTSVLNLNGIEFQTSYLDSYSVYKISESVSYLATVNSLNNLQEVEETILSIKGRYLADKPIPNDPFPWCNQIFGAWWALSPSANPEEQFLCLQSAWGEYTTGNPNVKLAIIDGGCDWTTTDFPTDNQLGWNFYNNTSNTMPYVFPNGERATHGTKMMSVISSKTNNNSGVFGIAGGWLGESDGITPMVMVTGGPEPLSALTAPCIYYACKRGVKVIHMSIGYDNILSGERKAIEKAINYAIEHYGTIFVASAGNYGSEFNWSSSLIPFPASYEPVIAVGGTNFNHLRWAVNGNNGTISASSYGPELDFVTSFQSFYNQGVVNPNGGLYEPIGCGLGTSFSAAMLSGVIALMYSTYPCLSYDDIFEALKVSCYKNPVYGIQGTRHDEVGYGFPNVKIALDFITQRTLPAQTISTNVTWNTPLYINGDVIVKSGSTLTITSKIKFGDQNRLFVEKGGHLVVDGGNLTSLCSNWDGIIAYGDATLPQIPETNQAKVTIINKGTIENALCGVRLCIPVDGKSIYDLSGGGGILVAENAIFKNCYSSISFAPYAPNNRSIISNCQFFTDKYYNTQIGFEGFVKLNAVNDIKIFGCSFEAGQYAQFKLFGVKSFNSHFTIDYYCQDPSSNPCPNELRLQSKFKSLSYGVYAENIGTNKFVTIRNSQFYINSKGIYGSALILPEITSNSFELPERGGYGLYMNNCDQYHVEDNTFITNSSSFSMDNIGMYINNSGSQNNEIYNNKFYLLGYGAIADGYNRNSVAQTGLCFKCNDFEGNWWVDILIPQITNPPINIYHGIKYYQGTPGSLNTDAAGNTFGTFWPAIYDIANYMNPFVYVHHEYFNQVRIIPTNRTWNTVSLQGNNNTAYTKNISCPPRLAMQDKSVLREIITEAEEGLQNAETQLAAFTDGGNTDELNQDVQTTQTSTSFALYEQLMATSPYLSDTVMKSGIDNTAALPDVMLRDILVANPQSAKSGEVMQALDNRTVPLPDEMKEEVQQGINTFASYDNMLANFALWKEKLSTAQKDLAHIYANDYDLMASSDSLSSLYCNTNTIESQYNIAMLELSRGNMAIAQQVLSNIPNSFVLSNIEQAKHQEFVDFTTKFSNLEQNENSILSADTSLLAQFRHFCTNEGTVPGALSRNLLHAAGYLEYTEPININMPLKSTSSHAANPLQKVTPPLASLEVYPNPATEYCMVKYNCLSENGNQIIISNLQGNRVGTHTINGLTNTILIPLQFLSSGSYTISLLSHGKVVQSIQLTVL